MPGIAACLEASRSVLSALAEGLAARGPDTAWWHERGLGVAVRAGLPAVHTADGVALAADGVIEPGPLLAAYADGGGAALLGPPRPYAVVLADPVRRSVFLVRNGDGPALYYAVDDTGTVLAASEPAALLAAGIGAEPDRDVVERFVATGACDEGPATFFAAVRRVLPDQILEARAGTVEEVASRSLQATAYAPVPVALRWAARGERVGVRYAQGIAGAALLGAAVSAQAEAAEDPAFEAAPVPVFPVGPAGAGDREHAGRVLAGLGEGVAVERPVRVDAETFAASMPDYVRDLGEPMPEASSYFLWAAARAAAGEVDVLLDAAGAETLLPSDDARAERVGHLSRLVDRVAARFGVLVRTPFPDMAGAGTALREELTAFLRSTLPERAAAAATGDGDDGPPPLEALMRTAREQFYRVFTSPRFASRPWVNQRRVLRGFGALVDGRTPPATAADDAGLFWRLYVLELWLRAHRPQAAVPRPRLPRERTVRGGVTWRRHPVRTRWFGPEDGPGGFVDAIAWYVGEFLAASEGRAVDGRGPWFVFVSARAAAVAQGRCTPMWRIRPGRLARLAARLTDADEWCTQVAVSDVGRGRVLRATVAGACGRMLRRPEWFERTLGSIAVRSLRGPAEGAPPPLDVGVLAPPRRPARLSARLSGEIRASLTGPPAESFGGCLLVTGDGGVLGRAVTDRGAAPNDEAVAAILGDDPLGARDASTPLCVVVRG